MSRLDSLTDATNRIVGKLPADLQTLLRLRFGLNGQPQHSRRKIAEAFGVSVAAIRKAEYYALTGMTYAPHRIELGLAAIRSPKVPPAYLSEVVEATNALTPALIDHLRVKTDDLRKIRWSVFEHIVAELLTQQGFKDVRLVGRDPRTSADIYATHVIDRTGLIVRFFVEVKRWKDRVGITVINEVLGAMLGERERHGWHASLIVATGGFADFSRYSRVELSLRGVDLKDRNDLLRWLRNYRPNKNGLWLPAPARALPT